MISLITSFFYFIFIFLFFSLSLFPSFSFFLLPFLCSLSLISAQFELVLPASPPQSPRAKLLLAPEMTPISLSAITATINAVKNSCSSPPQHAQTTIPARVLFGPEPPQSSIAPPHFLCGAVLCPIILQFQRRTAQPVPNSLRAQAHAAGVILPKLDCST